MKINKYANFKLNEKIQDDWNDCFNKVEEGLRNKPIYYRDNHNARGGVYLKELYDDFGINFDDGVDQLVDLVAYIISEKGYEITKKI